MGKNPNVDIETKVIRKFVDKGKQDRYIQSVSSVQNRKKFILDLAHFSFFDWTKLESVNGREEKAIYQALAIKGLICKTCYIISENARIDTRILGVAEAITQTVGYSMGTILVFGDAEMIYVECEGIKERYISK